MTEGADSSAHGTNATSLPPLPEQQQLAVLGSPIAHSKSPALHEAAYRELDLNWSYGRHELVAVELGGFLDGLDTSWRGLSLTMPLKREAFERCHWCDPVAEITGAVNTILFRADGGGNRGNSPLGDVDDAYSLSDAGEVGSGWQDTERRPIERRLAGFNTDVGGIVRALRRGGVSLGAGDHCGSRGEGETRSRVLLLGAGATAASALVAVIRLGASEVIAAVRNPERTADLRSLAERLGTPLNVITLEQARDRDALDAMGVNEVGHAGVGLVVNTIPGDNDAGVPVLGAVEVGFGTDRPAAGGLVPLFEVVYDPWPTRLAARWQQTAPVFSGLAMLVEQALLQVRIFVGGDPNTRLPNEDRVLEAMYRAVTPAAALP